MKRLPGFRFDAKAQLAHFEVVLPGAVASKRGKWKHVRRRRTIAASDYFEATTKYHEFRKEVLEAKPSAPQAPPATFGSYVKRHWPTMKKRVSERTAALDTDTIERRLLPFFGALDLAAITGPVVQDFVGTLRSDGYVTRGGEKKAFAPDTINMALRALRKILRDAVERGELATYPIRGKLPLEKTTPLRLELSRGELRAFVAAFDDEGAFRAYIEEEHAAGPVRISDHFGGKPRVFGGGLTRDSLGADYYFERFHAARVLFVVALETGLAKKDLLGRRWASVDLENGWVRATEREDEGRGSDPDLSRLPGRPEKLRGSRRRLARARLRDGGRDALSRVDPPPELRDREAARRDPPALPVPRPPAHVRLAAGLPRAEPSGDREGARAHDGAHGGAVCPARRSSHERCRGGPRPRRPRTPTANSLAERGR